jgi:hypothetical protein
VKRVAILIAAAAVALAPAAAAPAQPRKAPERAAKTTKPATNGASAQRRCREERGTLGPAAFAAKYGKARTKGSAKARSKAARAAFGRCVKQVGRQIRAERRAAAGHVGEDAEAPEDELLDGDGELGPDAEEGAAAPEPGDGEAVADLEPGEEARHPDAEGPGVGLGGEPELG